MSTTLRRGRQLLPFFGRSQPGLDHRRERAPSRADHRSQHSLTGFALHPNSTAAAAGNSMRWYGLATETSPYFLAGGYRWS